MMCCPTSIAKTTMVKLLCQKFISTITKKNNCIIKTLTCTFTGIFLANRHHGPFEGNSCKN